MSRTRSRRRRPAQKSRFSQPTKAEKLQLVLSDGKPHSTKELARRVGHTFAAAKLRLVRCGFDISVSPHPRLKWQFMYQMMELHGEDARRESRPRRRSRS